MQDKVKRLSGQKGEQECKRGHRGQDGPFLWYEQLRYPGGSQLRKKPSKFTVYLSWIVRKSTQKAFGWYELQSFLQQGNPSNTVNSQ